MADNIELILKSIDDRIGLVHGALYGNGDPSSGLIASNARMEERQSTNAKALETLAKDVTEINGCVKEHSRSFHVGKFVGKKGFWAGFIVFLVAAHSILELGHPWIVAALKFLGFPIA